MVSVGRVPGDQHIEADGRSERGDVPIGTKQFKFQVDEKHRRVARVPRQGVVIGSMGY
jgi:hypothetical protein